MQSSAAVFPQPGQRVDIWLWAVRQVKTRSLAARECKLGRVRVNGVLAKPSQTVRIGDEVRYRFQGFDRVLLVRELLEKRAGAPVAQRCYEDVSPPRPTALRLPPPLIRAKGTGRPTKKERRELERFLEIQRNSAI